MGDANRLELDLGWRGNNGNGSNHMALSDIYHWVMNIDGGFNFEDLIYKQSLIPLTPVGSTIIFKNRFYGQSTNFTTDKNELDQ